MMIDLQVQKMTQEGFAPFGDLIDFDRKGDFFINNGMCERFHALAETEAVGDKARVIISLGRAQAYPLPLKLEMMERHPLGSQAFIPLQPAPFLVIVAPDMDGKPGTPQAFLTSPGQGVNYHRGTWHAVLTPLGESADFIIVDRAGSGENLEEFDLPQPYQVLTLPD